jgi:hypothetical protein
MTTYYAPNPNNAPATIRVMDDGDPMDAISMIGLRDLADRYESLLRRQCAQQILNAVPGYAFDGDIYRSVCVTSNTYTSDQAFVAVGTNVTPRGLLAFSRNGEEWTANAEASGSNAWRGVASGQINSIDGGILVVGDDGLGNPNSARAAAFQSTYTYAGPSWASARLPSYPGTCSAFNAVANAVGTTWIIVGNGGAIYRALATSATTWNLTGPISPPGSYTGNFNTVIRANFGTTQRMIIGGNAGEVEVSDDLGLTWFKRAIGTSSDVIQLLYIAATAMSPSIVLAITRGGVRRSVDNGETWTGATFASSLYSVASAVNYGPIVIVYEDRVTTSPYYPSLASVSLDGGATFPFDKIASRRVYGAAVSKSQGGGVGEGGTLVLGCFSGLKVARFAGQL